MQCVNRCQAIQVRKKKVRHFKLVFKGNQKSQGLLLSKTNSYQE